MTYSADAKCNSESALDKQGNNDGSKSLNLWMLELCLTLCLVTVLMRMRTLKDTEAQSTLLNSKQVILSGKTI